MYIYKYISKGAKSMVLGIRWNCVVSFLGTFWSGINVKYFGRLKLHVSLGLSNFNNDNYNVH